MLELLCVALGGAVGGVARYAVSGWVARRIGETFPWGTLAVNLLGSAVLGAAAAGAQGGAGWASLPAVWALLATGLLGSFTTVSSWALQTFALLRDGERRRAIANLVMALATGPAAAAAGLAVGARLWGGG